MSLDQKDRAILQQLSRNSRQSLFAIKKKTGIPTSVIDYRIKRLEKAGIIKKYFLVVDFTKLGYRPFTVMFSTQYATPLLEKKIIKKPTSEYDYLKNYLRTIEEFDVFVLEFVENWKSGTDQVDDILVIGIRM